MSDKLLQIVTDELCKHFNDPIDIECPYCEAAKAVISLVRADMQREIEEKFSRDGGIELLSCWQGIIIEGNEWRAFKGGE